ncbi:MAG: hypothetical protein DMF84_23075 [Acidobacteria bacterium]|nr:MAG: hypothetical protein DMF84_23075 [Acidobacteriota bacterium]
MSRQDDVIARQRAAFGLYAKRSCTELVGGTVLVDMAAGLADSTAKTRKISAWMKARLTIESNPGPQHEWHLVDERRVEAEIGGKHRLLLERDGLAPLDAARRCMEVRIDPFKRAVDPMLTDDGIDLRDRCESRVPHGLRVVTTETLHQGDETLVGHHRQVRGCVTRIDLRAPLAFEQGNRLSSFREAELWEMSRARRSRSSKAWCLAERSCAEACSPPLDGKQEARQDEPAA